MRAFCLARQLAGFGHSVQLLASRQQAGTRPLVSIRDSVRVVEFPDLVPARLRNGGLSPVDTLARMSWVTRQPFDVIHAFDHRPAVSLPALVAKNRGALLVSDWADLWGRDGIGAERKGAAGWLLRMADDYWEPRFRRRVDGVSVISRVLWDRAARLGVPERRRLLLPPGADVDLIRTLPRVDMRRHYHLPTDAHVVVSTGFSAYDEGLQAETIVEILAGDTEAWAMTCGARSALLQRAIREHALEDRVRSLGVIPIDDLGRVMACADVLLLPYSRKPVNLARFPNRFGEFIAAGRAIVTNPTGDLGEIVAENQLGELADEDPIDMSRKVLRLFGDRRRAAEFGHRARAFAEERFSWEKRARDVERFYGALLDDDAD